MKEIANSLAGKAPVTVRVLVRATNVHVGSFVNPDILVQGSVRFVVNVKSIGNTISRFPRRDIKKVLVPVEMIIFWNIRLNV